MPEPEPLTNFEDEEPLEFVWGCKQDRELNRPEDEMADHLLSGNADRFWNVVGNIKVRWPDCTDTLGHCSRSGVCLNSMPK